MVQTCDGYEGDSCENDATVELTIESGLGSRTEQYCEECGENVKTDIAVPQSDERILNEKSL